MNHLPALISDLALILLCAGVMTLLFKRLKQPLVLGYIVAGFLASPHMPYIPSVIDVANIKTWADIGVIFLLFSLGLEFSFKKLLKIGSTPIIAVLCSLAGMLVMGFVVGFIFHWPAMDCVYLGGMLAMSSTSIIFKAFDDMGLRQQRFAGIVFSVLILEDIIAIVMMLLFSTLSVSQNFEGTEMLFSILKLVFFLVLWFTVGIYLIPLFLKKNRRWMSDEMLLIVALSLCLGMVVLASAAGFSPAFGAFIMGSIFAETVEAERIERLVSPIKDLFGAIFFVSVGMMVDPALLAQYWCPIVVITLVVLVGRSTVDSCGFLLAGQPLKLSMQCGYSLAQVGEFAFIIATLGISLGVISDFLYPIVVSVSVITTFTTPYMIRLAGPASNFVERHLPAAWKAGLEHYGAGFNTVNNESKWHKLLMDVLRLLLVYSVLCLAVQLLFFRFLEPLLADWLSDFWARFAGTVLALACMSPFLRSLVLKRMHSPLFMELWHDNLYNRAPLTSLALLRVSIVVLFIVMTINHFFRTSVTLMAFLVVVLLLVLLFSRKLKKQERSLEKTFMSNLNSRELVEKHNGKISPEYAHQLLTRDIHLSDFVIPEQSSWAGKTLVELNFGKLYGIHIVSVLRGELRINIPGPQTRLFPADRLQVIGTDEQLKQFDAVRTKEVIPVEAEPNLLEREMHLQQMEVTADSPFLGKSVDKSGIRNHYQCLLVGIDRGDTELLRPRPDLLLKEGDVLWIVGEQSHVRRILNDKIVEPLNTTENVQ